MPEGWRAGDPAPGRLLPGARAALEAEAIDLAHELDRHRRLWGAAVGLARRLVWVEHLLLCGRGSEEDEALPGR